MATEGGHGPQTSGDYIAHHLQNLQVCKAETGEWVWNHCAGNPMAINVDSMFWSVFLGLLFIWIFGRVARRATAGVPGKMQVAIEMIVDFVFLPRWIILVPESTCCLPLEMAIE